MTERGELARWIDVVGGQAAFEALAALEPSHAVFVVDADQRIVHWSPGAEAMLGHRAHEVVGEHCLKANRCEQCIRGCGVQEHGTIDGIPLVLHRPDGTAVAVRKYARAFRDEAGRFLGGIELLVQQRAGTEVRVQEEGVASFHGLITRDPAMKELFRTLQHVASTEGTVLVRGESGTGKELVARAVHDESHRARGPFVAINCAALSAGLLESELFGHVRGAFTGAVRDRPGVFSRADGGTLFLDEVAELPLELQAKLLRVLQEQTFVPVGGSRQQSVDVRIVAATHRSLRSEVESGRFRQDLMYRLRVIPLFLPPLRDRRGDVDLLLKHFIRKNNDLGGRRVRCIAPDAMRVLLDHSWPGNVREVQNVVEYAFAVGRGDTVELRDLPPEFRERAIEIEPLVPSRAAVARPVRPLTEAEEKQAIARALAEADGHIGEAANALGMSRPTFWRKRKKYGIE